MGRTRRLRGASLCRRRRSRSASRRSRARSGGPRAAGPRRPIPPSPTSTRSTGAATSPPGRSRSSSRRRSAQRSGRFVDARRCCRRSRQCEMSRFGTRHHTQPSRSAGHIPPLSGATGWLSSEPLDPTELRGHVVLVNFWTLTCINWLRQEPYVRAWSQAYRDDGLIVIGSHTPEFSFEHEIGLVRQATKEREIDYPVAVDNDYEVWSAFDNH